jgi:RNA polymerase sigma-70 factor (ECF subfamily)
MKEMSLGIADIGLNLTRSFDLDSIVENYRPRIFRFALASLRDHDDAETVTQDCFLRAHKARQSFRNDCSLQTWLMQIAVNLVRDHLRSRRLQFWKHTRTLVDGAAPLTDFVSGERSPEMAVIFRQQLDAVWSAANHLPERQKTVFLLRFVEDMDILEIAEVAGMKEGTVKTHLFRALATVRRKLGMRP